MTMQEDIRKRLYADQEGDVQREPGEGEELVWRQEQFSAALAGLDFLAGACNDYALSKGFPVPSNMDAQAELVLAKIALITTEISRAAEAVQTQDAALFAHEMADALVRLFDLCGGLMRGSAMPPLSEAFDAVWFANANRPRKHGKRI